MEPFKLSIFDLNIRSSVYSSSANFNTIKMSSRDLLLI